MAENDHNQPLPIATLDVTQIVEAIEQYVQAHRPDLMAQVGSHGVRMSSSGEIRWELHSEQQNGLDVRLVERLRIAV